MQGKLRSFFGLGAIAFGLCAASAAQGAIGDFQYGTIVTPSPINPAATVGGPGSQLSQVGVGNFTSPTAPTFSATVNPLGTDIVVGTLNVTDLGIGAYTDTYLQPITVSLKIRDVTSSASGVFTFTGRLSGTVASNGTTDGATFANPFTAGTQAQVIGGELYTVKIDPTTDFAAPGAPPVGGTGLNGTYTFNVSAGAVPEPAAMGLLAVAAGALLRRRRMA